MSPSLIKYPRTPHLEGSRLQPGDEDLDAVPFSAIAGRHLVVEEKMDGANCAFRFNEAGELLLQSRGHYLTGGPREKHFTLLKQWAGTQAGRLFERLGSQYVVFGEWLFAKHTIYYDALPHYFLEFDIWDTIAGLFLATPTRRELLAGLPIVPVRVLAAGAFGRVEDLKALVGTSGFITPDSRTRLADDASRQDLDPGRILRETDPSPIMEGLYIKVEEGGAVVGRYKYIRTDFLTAVTQAEGHWLNRPIVPNRLRDGVDLFWRGGIDLMNDPDGDSTNWTFPGCPEPPDWSFDWDRLCAERPAISALHGCPQDPEHHAEGDVGIHTRRVCDELAGLDAWRRLRAWERSLVFAATLFHDVAKPMCTREDMGRITARGHARRGAKMARLALWKPDEAGAGPETETPLPIREAIVGLVRHHGLPLSWPREADPTRRLIEASYQCRLDWLALLAEADVRGRDCADRAGLLDRVALFRELADEEGCLDRPRSFASEHTRFLYFQGRDLCPDEPAYDDTRGTVIVMSGLPGAGKDTWIRRNVPERPVIALDEIRRELGVDPHDDQGTVANVGRDRARILLRAGTSFVWNATNLTRPVRDSLIRLFASYRARVELVYVEAPWGLLDRRNRGRRHPVPWRVVESMAAKLEVPCPVEAHEVAWFDRGDRVGP